MRTILGLAGSLALALVLTTPALATHDNGNQKSNDIHTRNGGAVSVSTPEPVTLAAVGVGLLALGLIRRRRK